MKHASKKYTQNFVSKLKGNTPQEGQSTNAQIIQNWLLKESGLKALN